MKTMQLDWIAEILPIWRQRIGRESKDLDFSDPEDRAVFRGRLAVACGSLKTSALRTLAEAFGAERVPLSHEGAVLALANAWIRKAKADS